MSLRVVLVALLAMAACGGPPPKKEIKNAQGREPTTAREKQLLEAKANGDLDDGDNKWGKWRYGGDRKNCVYVVNGNCYKTQKSGCAKLGCKKGTTCKGDGGGPITLTCKAS